MTLLDKLHHPVHYLKLFFKWGGLGILMGVPDDQYGVKK